MAANGKSGAGRDWRHDEDPVGSFEEVEALRGAVITDVLASGSRTISGAIAFYELVLQLSDGRTVVVEPNTTHNDGDAAATLVVSIDPSV